jgi:hypothetical protein
MQIETFQSGELIAAVHLNTPDAGSNQFAGRHYQARFVRAGRVRGRGGKPGDILITPQALQDNLALFNERAVFVDHAAAGSYPSLQRLVGVTHSARWDDSEQAVHGEIQLYATPLGQAIGELLDETLQAEAPDVGLSLVCWPSWQPGEDGERRLVGIQHVESIDLVFEPAADGRVLARLSSYFQKGAAMAENEAEMELTPSQPEVATQNPGRWQTAVARLAAAQLIAGSGLPAAARQRLDRGDYATPEALQQAIDAERAYLAELQAGGVVQIGGTPPRGGQVQVGMDGLERLTLALEALIAGVRPPAGIQPLSGIREFYHLISGDYEMNGVFQPERVGFASVTSATMAQLVANALNKVVVNEFQQYPQWWLPVVQEQDFASLQAVRWITLGGVGELPTVAEGAAYTELTWDDSYETASFSKKGGYLGLTLEAIDKDDTGRLRAAPRALAQAAWLTLSKAIAAIFTSNSGAGPTLTDGVALFHANHANLGSTALSVASWNATRALMRKQTELNSGERIGALTAPKYLLVPPDLEITALQVLASEVDYTYALSNGVAAPVNVNAEGGDLAARMNAARSRVLVVDLWTDTNDWAAVADPRLWPTIGIGYRYGRAPELFSVASPTAGLLFTNDTLPVKVRFFFAAGAVDYRGVYKHNVA